MGIQTKIYEDGLIVISIDPRASMKDSVAALSEYYDEKLSPALSYLFSLGAPVPKELANIKTIYPYFVVLSNAEHSDVENIFSEFEENEHSHVETKAFSVYRGDSLYVVNNVTETSEHIEQLISEQIFLREFKAQLHQYLNLHRRIWDRIALVKERGTIMGYEIGPLRKATEGYSKTINLIETRISQMSAYISTRESVFMSKKTLAAYANVLEYEYETLIDTHRYIKD